VTVRADSRYDMICMSRWYFIQECRWFHCCHERICTGSHKLSSDTFFSISGHF